MSSTSLADACGKPILIRQIASGSRWAETTAKSTRFGRLPDAVRPLAVAERPAGHRSRPYLGARWTESDAQPVGGHGGRQRAGALRHSPRGKRLFAVRHFRVL